LYTGAVLATFLDADVSPFFRNYNINPIELVIVMLCWGYCISWS
jgi:hypothetical protein